MTECEQEDGCVCFVSPGDATVVQPLLSSHNDVESAAKVVWLHIHDLMTTRVKILNKCVKAFEQATSELDRKLK